MTVILEIFIIAVMFLLIGPIKPDWLADCSSSDKAPLLTFPFRAHCSGDHGQDQGAGWRLSEAALTEIPGADDRGSGNVPSCVSSNFHIAFVLNSYKQSDSIGLTLRLTPQMSVSTWFLMGMLFNWLSCRPGFLSLGITEILDLITICCRGPSCAL